MTDEQFEALFQELADLLHTQILESRALRQMLADHEVIDEDELDQRIKDITMEEVVDLKAEMYRRACERALKGRPVQ